MSQSLREKYVADRLKELITYYGLPMPEFCVTDGDEDQVWPDRIEMVTPETEVSWGIARLFSRYLSCLATSDQPDKALDVITNLVREKWSNL